MIRIVVLSNTRSYRNRSALERIERLLAGAGDVLHVRIDDMATLAESLRTAAQACPEVLAINSGDGTIMAVLSEMLVHPLFASRPRLVLLRGGRTNMTAGDVGPAGSNAAALSRLLRLRAEDRLDRAVIHRPMLWVENVRDRPPLCGAFLGDAGIVQAITLCRDRAHALGMSAGLASAWTLVNAIVERLVRRTESPLFAGTDMRIGVDGSPLPVSRWVTAIASTLDRLVLGSRPFWNVGDAPIRFTGIAAPAPGLVRAAARVLYGGESRGLPAETYVSRGAHSLTFETAGPFTLDGEMFEPEPGRPLKVSATAPLAFLKF